MPATSRCAGLGRRGTRAAVALAFVAAAGSFEAAEPLASSGARVSYANDALTIDATSVAGRDLLAEIGREVGFVLRTEGANLDRAVTVSFDGVPFDQGMRAILRQIGATNHALLYDPTSNQPVALVVFGDGGGSPGKTMPIAPAVAAAPVEATAPVVNAVAPPPVPLVAAEPEARRQERRRRFEERRAQRRNRMSGSGLMDRLAGMRAQHGSEEPASLIAEE